MPEKSIFEKLQLKSGRSMLILDPPPGYLEKAGNVPENSLLTLENKPADIAQVFIRSKVELEKTLPLLGSLILPGGIIWISYPKLTSKLRGDINRDSINLAAQASGWTGIAMISIDDDWSALRLKRL
jgi:hypothetical protein